MYMYNQAVRFDLVHVRLAKMILITATCFLTSGKKDEEYRHLLGMFGVSGDLAVRPIASLSGGQKSRLAFAIMAVPRCVHRDPKISNTVALHDTVQ